MAYRFVPTAILLLASLAAAAEPATQPAIPPLVVGGEPKSFLVQGAMLTAANHLGFSVAVQGDRQLTVFYDAIDGTPVFVSDGKQTLIYDLSMQRLVLLPSSCVQVAVAWDAAAQRVAFKWGLQMNPDAEKLKEAFPRFGLDALVKHAGQDLKPVSTAGMDASEWRGPDGRRYRFEVSSKGDAFRVTSQKPPETTASMLIDVTHIGHEIPAAMLSFPDPKQFPASLNVTSVDTKTLLAAVRDGKVYLTKLALCSADAREFADKLMPGMDWADLKKQDVAFGASYREALAKQGINLKTYDPPPATQPAK